MGVKRAAQRKVDHELGIKSEQFPLDNIHFITRIKYFAAYDNTWGEREIDHILVFRGDVNVVANPEEVAEVRYVTKEDVRELLQHSSDTLTPWFKRITESGLLFQLWDDDQVGSAAQHNLDNIIEL
eukprot:TRINITY_DN2570_c0_g1_i1.p3 TRINITY_DN2570_c0_g1~~TRINITY_DN2570_c0_g1_i1.p3  ORF type:complete len:126 (-),score=40.80 TRINITY_DN2570_c0_g1_i1:45-422(-)